LSGFDLKLKKNDLNCFWKEIKNGFEEKEKKEKENLKIKEFKKGKIYFWRTYQNCLNFI